MKTSIHIKKTLKKIEILWLKHKDLRLCQLIQNPFGIEDIYHCDDKLLIEKLKKYYKEN